METNIILFLSARPEQVKRAIEDCKSKFHQPKITAIGSLDSINTCQYPGSVEKFMSWGTGLFSLKKGWKLRSKIERKYWDLVVIPCNNTSGTGYGHFFLFSSFLGARRVVGANKLGNWQELETSPKEIFMKFVRKHISFSSIISLYGMFCYSLMVSLELCFHSFFWDSSTNNNRRREKKTGSEDFLQIRRPSKVKVSAPDISIVIRTMNEDRFIGKTLDKVFCQKRKDFEVILVDSGSTDKTLDIAKEYPVLLVEMPTKEFTYGYALNVGARMGRGEIIVNLSAHALPKNNDWLDKLVENLEKYPDAAGVFGKEGANPEFCNPVEEKHLLDTFPERWFIHSKDRFFSNANSAIQRMIWEKFPFDETISWAEDQLWAKTVQDAGYFTIYDPEAEVLHSHNLSCRKAYRRAFLYELTLNKMDEKRRNLSEWHQFKIWWDRLQDTNRFLQCRKDKRGKYPWLFLAPFYEYSIYAGTRDALRKFKNCSGSKL